jgi:tetratricopeptide (TPR) repeat protein
MAKKKSKKSKKSSAAAAGASKAGPKRDGFDDVDDFFFGSETGAFQRDEFDYDPFEDHTDRFKPLEGDLPPGEAERTRVAMNVNAEIKELLEKELAASPAEEAVAADSAASSSEEQSFNQPDGGEHIADDDFFGDFEGEPSADEAIEGTPPSAPDDDFDRPTELAVPAEDWIQEAESESESADPSPAEPPAQAPPVIDEAAADLPDLGEDIPPPAITDDIEEWAATIPSGASLPDDLRAVSPTAEPLPTAPAPVEPRRSIADLSVISEMPSAEMSALTDEDIARSGEWAAAVTELATECDALAEHGPSEQRASYLYELGRLLGRRLGDWTGAQPRFQEALEVDPTFLPARRALVQLMISREDWPTAAAQLDLLAEHATDSGNQAAALVEGARIRMTHLAELEEASDRLRQAHELLPTNYVVARYLREVLWRQEKWAESVTLSQSLRPSLNAGQRLRGDWEMGRLCDEKLGDSDQAVVHFAAALSEDGLFIPALLELERLLRESKDQAGLASAWRTSAPSWGPADAALWFARAAREGDSAGAPAEVVEGDYQSAIDVSPAPEILVEEYRQWLEFNDRWADLGDVVTAALEAETHPRQRASLLSLMGRTLSRDGGDDAAASDYFKQALEADPSCVEASEACRQLLMKQGDWSALMALFEGRVAASSDSRTQVALRLKMAEVAAFEMDDLQAALVQLEEANTLSPNSLLILDSLARVAIRLGDHRAAAERLEQTASVVEEEAVVAAYLRRAASHWMADGKPQRAISAIKRALSDVGETVLAREELSEAYRAAGQWSEAATVLREAADETSDAALKDVLLYRSARLSVSHADDPEAAEVAYRQILDASPDFLAASLDLRDIYVARGDHSGLGRLQKAEAESCVDSDMRSWLHLGAGLSFERAGDSESALSEYHAGLTGHEECPVAHGALRRIYRRTGDVGPLLASYRNQLQGETDPSRQAALRIQRVAVLHAQGDAVALEAEVEELLALPNVDLLPLASLGIICEAVQATSAALKLYTRAAEIESLTPALRASCLYQAGLLLEEVEELEDLGAAVAAHERACGLVPAHEMAFEALERIHAATENSSALAGVFEREADATSDPSVRAFYSLQAGEQYEASGDNEAAARVFPGALIDPVARDWAWESVVRLGVDCRDSDLLVAATVAATEGALEQDSLDRMMTLGERLVFLENGTAALAAFAQVLEVAPSFLPVAYHLEQVHVLAESWEDAVSTQELIASLATSDSVAEAAEARMQQILEERGITSDKAFEFYQRVHEDEPENLAALRGLAGIHLSRGDNEAAVKFYKALAEAATDPSVQAEAATKLGCILLETDGDHEAAQSHLERAIDLDPKHRPALQALRAHYTRQENWQSLVGIVARESALCPLEQRLPYYTEIALLWEEKLGNTAAAISSWKTVLGEDPDHSEALSRLLALHEAAEDWSSYLDVAECSLKELSGADLRARQAELGILASQRAGDDTRALRLLRSAVSGDEPPLSALEALGDIASGRGEWEQYLATLERRMVLVSTDAERVALLALAATTQLDQLMDRSAAAESYRRALGLEPDFPAALAFFVDYLFDEERWPEARPLFARYETQIAARDHDDDESIEATGFFYKFGVVLAHCDSPKEALARFAAALELTPTHLPSLEAAFPRYAEQGEWERVRAIGREILRLRGGAGEAEEITRLHVSLGNAEFQLDNAEVALKHFKKALEKAAGDVPALEGLARVHRATSDWNSLLSTYNSIIKFAREPAQAVEAYMTKGDVLDRELNFTDKAVLHFEKVLMYDKTNFGAVARLAQIAVARGDLERAGSFADKARGAARSDSERIQGELLSRLCAAAESVDVAELLSGIDGDDPVVASFQNALGATGEVPRQDAARAFRATLASA